MTRVQSPEPQVVNAAAEFLNHPLDRHRKEGNLQSDLEVLLRVIGVGSLESHYTTADGEADIYLPNRRTFIELKGYPLAGAPNKPQQGKNSESPRGQLDRYVIGEINRELRRIPEDDDEHNRSNWKGIVTDGRNWHVYEYPHRVQSVGRSISPPKSFLNEAEALAGFLHTLFSERRFGREWIPSEPGYLFTALKTDLVRLYRELPTKTAQTTQTKKELWLDMMRTSGMVPRDDIGRDRLFVTHSFLIAAVRFVSHSLPFKSPADWASSLQDGFASWVLEFQRGVDWAETLYRQISTYDWRRREEDVLRSLYQHNVSVEDRKVFGEFYTPDWLAALMVEEVLDEAWMERAIYNAAIARRKSKDVKGVGLLDPTCGSGTFLIQAARRLLNATPMQNFTPVEKADIVCSLVNGMDIHPVAVELARVNLERLLPAMPSEGSMAFQIYLGDSLQAGASEQQSVFGHADNQLRLITPKGRDIFLPMTFVQSRFFANDLRTIVNSADGKTSFPEYLTTPLSRDEIRQLKECHSSLTKIISNEGNSVWTWYMIHIAAPYLLTQRKVDRIVANPPWVKLADIQVSQRKKAMEQYGRRLGLSGDGKQAPHPDIASYFILAARQLYLADPQTNPASWLVKKSAISSGQWGPFREIHKNTLKQSVDLQALQPFGGGDATRSCLLMEHRTLKEWDVSGIARVEARLTIQRDRPEPAEPLASARRKFQFVETPAPLPKAPSAYVAASGIQQGATLVPHVLALLEEVKGLNHNDLMEVTTRRAQKDPWKKIAPQKGLIPPHWIHPVLTSSQMLAYVPLLRRIRAIIPTDQQGRLLEAPGEICPFWRVLDEIYDKHKGIGRSTPKTLLKRFDFQKGLSAQLNRDNTLQWMVLYPSSGDIMRGARTRTRAGIADSTLFWLTVRSEAEAGFLVALLNADCLQRAYKESQDSGRDFQLHPWRKVPIPRFDEANQQHQRLAGLCTEAETIAQQVTDETLAYKPNLGQVGLSKAIRQVLRGSAVGQEIETIVTDLLPDQATRAQESQ